MKYWGFSCVDWLEWNTTGGDQLFTITHRDFRRLANIPEVCAFARQWVKTIQDMPEHQRGQMVGWWTRKVGELASQLKPLKALEPWRLLGRDGGQERRLRHMAMLVVYVTLMEWFAMGGREGVWNEYMTAGGKRIVHKKFFKDFRAYEKKSLVDRSMMLAFLERGDWFWIPEMARESPLL